ncbi:MAG: hypothetical protein PHV18_11550, partial [Lachnospiraceae bacterium]|nr:hypothetical protein [Lachnospiraceae bacterium]
AMTGWINKAKDQQNDMTGRAAMLAVQSAGAEKLKTKNAIPEFKDADGVTDKQMQEYLKDDNVVLTGYEVTEGVRITKVNITIDGTAFTYPRSETESGSGAE